MPLTFAAIKQRFLDEMDASFGPADDVNKREEAAEFQANVMLKVLTLDTTVNVTSVSGVTTGGGVSGPGTGNLS